MKNRNYNLHTVACRVTDNNARGNDNALPLARNEMEDWKKNGGLKFLTI